MPSLRRDKKSMKETEQATHCVVEWLESEDIGLFSLVPRRKIVNEPPLHVGDTVTVKYATSRGACSSSAKIASLGTNDAMERALDRCTKQHTLQEQTVTAKSDLREKSSDASSWPIGGESTDEDEDEDDEGQTEKSTMKTSVEAAVGKRKNSKQPSSSDADARHKQLSAQSSSNEASSKTSATLSQKESSTILSEILTTVQTLKDRVSGIETSLSDISTTVSNIEKHVKEDKDSRLDSFRSPQQKIVQTLNDEPSTPVKFQDVVLTEIHAPPRELQKYARKLLTHLFSEEEMEDSLFSKTGNTTESQLSPNRCNTLMNCLKKKYDPGYLQKSLVSVTASLNQKC